MMAIAAVQRSGPVVVLSGCSGPEEESRPAARVQYLFLPAGVVSLHRLVSFHWFVDLQDARALHLVFFFLRVSLEGESAQFNRNTSYLIIFLFFRSTKTGKTEDKLKSQSSRLISSDCLVQVLLGQCLDKGCFVWGFLKL